MVAVQAGKSRKEERGWEGKIRWLPDFLGSEFGLMVMFAFVRCRPGTVNEQLRDWV